jgi:hypothetical protein
MLNSNGELQLITIFKVPTEEEAKQLIPFAYYEGDLILQMTKEFTSFLEIELHLTFSGDWTFTKLNEISKRNCECTPRSDVLAYGYGWEIRKKKLTNLVFNTEIWGAELIRYSEMLAHSQAQFRGFDYALERQVSNA